MKWIEEIRISTQPQKDKEVAQFLLETAALLRPTKQLESARVYSHHFVPASFNLILFWDTATVPVNGSETALLIIEGLKKLGLIDHTVFMERGTSKKLKSARRIEE